LVGGLYGSVKVFEGVRDIMADDDEDEDDEEDDEEKSIFKKESRETF
jgi:cadmium resistance protein CadD (predicted permease)